MERSRLILINGAPGSGKSSVAAALANEVPMMLALDIDGVKHALGGWADDPVAAGLRAREIALAAADEHLRAGYAVVIGQYVARVPFLEALERLTARHATGFAELVLHLDAEPLAARLRARAAAPDRPEHAINNLLVGPDDAAALVESLEPLHDLRPRAMWIDADGSPATTLARVRTALEAGAPSDTGSTANPRIRRDGCSPPGASSRPG